MTCLLGTTLLGFTFYSYKGRCKLNQTRRFRAIQKPLPHQLGSLCLLSLKEYLPPKKKKPTKKNQQPQCKQTRREKLTHWDRTPEACKSLIPTPSLQLQTVIFHTKFNVHLVHVMG